MPPLNDLDPGPKAVWRGSTYGVGTRVARPLGPTAAGSPHSVKQAGFRRDGLARDKAARALHGRCRTLPGRMGGPVPG